MTRASISRWYYSRVRFPLATIGRAVLKATEDFYCRVALYTVFFTKFGLLGAAIKNVSRLVKLKINERLLLDFSKENILLLQLGGSILVFRSKSLTMATPWRINYRQMYKLAQALAYLSTFCGVSWTKHEKISNELTLSEDKRVLGYKVVKCVRLQHMDVGYDDIFNNNIFSISNSSQKRNGRKGESSKLLHRNR